MVLNMSRNSTSSQSSMDVDDENVDLQEAYTQKIEEMQTLLQEGSTSIHAVERVSQCLKESLVLSKKERTVKETILGSEALSLCAQVSRNQAQSLDTNFCQFDPSTFAFGIRNYAIDPEGNGVRFDWKRVAKRTTILFRRAPVYSYMYGSFKPTELPPKPVKERSQRAPRQAEAAQRRRPEQLATVEATDEGNAKVVQDLIKKIKKETRNTNGVMSFFKCVLHPTSFAQTIENIFHVSFLVKDHYVLLSYDGDGLPIISVVQDGDHKVKKDRKKQCIVGINVQQWQELVRVFRITEPFIQCPK